MKCFLFFVVLISLHINAYGKNITMFVNVNDTVDLIVDRTYNIYSCQVKQYSTNTEILQFRKKYDLISQGNWELEREDNDTTYYFELLDYYKSCSFSISPFPRFFYGRWIVNTTTIHVDQHKENQYQYKYTFQEFFFPIPPTGKFENSTSNLESTNDKENINCVNYNPLSLRPKKVFGQVKKCLATYHYVFRIQRKGTEALRSYQIYPNTDDRMIFTGNNNSCQFKIFQIKSRYMLGNHERLTGYHKWEITTDYKDHQLENKTLKQHFNIHMIGKFDSDTADKYYVPRLPIKPGLMYLQMKLKNDLENSTIPKFKCQFDAKDRQTEMMEISEYNDSLPLQDDFYRRIKYEDAYGYYFNFKYHGYYDCILRRENKIDEIYHFETENTTLLGYPIKLFDPLPNQNNFTHYYNIRAVVGSLFPCWLMGNVPYIIHSKKLRIIIEMPNGTLVGTFYIESSVILQLIKPKSKKLSAGKYMNYLYDGVSIIYNGIWTMHYHILLSTDLEYPVFTAFYSVTTWDSTHVKVIVDMTTKNSSISMYNIQKNPKRCLFMSTDGTVIEESKPTVQTIEKQRPSGFKINEIDSLSECEFKINQSLKNNYGMKELLIDYGNFTINRTIILHNNFHGIKKYNKISDMYEKNNRHFLKHNDEFLVNCSDNRPLLFCRIQAPTQQVTHITDKNTLKAGDCSMLVKNANILEHNGTWKCQLAFDESDIGSTIIDYYFSVEVRNFYVRSHIEYINETDERINETIIKRVVFHCNISNYLETYENDLIGGHQIDHCSWGHPNGSIIFENSNEYTVNTTTLFSCDLTIHNLHERDIGNWTCSPYLNLLTNLNLHNTIQLFKFPKMIILKNYTITPSLISKITTYDDYHCIRSTGPGLDCHIYPAVKAHMINCKWTKMHGAINFTAGDIDDSHYFPRKKNSLCELRFTEWVEFGEKSDYGKWRCCVDIVDSVKPTVCQDIELPNVYSSPKEGIGMYILISIVIICLFALIGSCFYFIIKKLKEKLENKRKKKQRQSRRSRSARRRRRARSATHQSRVRSSNRQNQARSSSHPRQPNSSLPSSQQDAQASRIISARIHAEPNTYV